MAEKILAYSGGKDSTATALHLKEKGIKFTPVFCDTGWEHPLTLDYLDYANNTFLGGDLVTIRSEKFKGMRDLVTVKKRVPSAKARFCTEALKVKPMIEWLAANEVDIVYQGIRSRESKARAAMHQTEWSDAYDATIIRPILDWDAEQVFAIHKKYAVKPNPLYTYGASRVGCFPCVMVNHGELKRMSVYFPEVWARIHRLEKITGCSFFPPNYIPPRFHTGFDSRSEKTYPTAEDVKKYVIDPGNAIDDSEPPKCMSVYNLCE
jgi:3'-phosphoadenosine 5'-phosphosulfate sulfotransferase (PAPS reductase)/FAD synthetase